MLRCPKLSLPLSIEFQISCHFGDSNASEESQPVVFDLRQAPISPCSSKSVRVLQQFFIGDDVEHARFHGDVRVLVEEVSDWDDGELKSILLDSGADAAVFPKEYATAGLASNMPDLQLHDAQGRQIPVMGMRAVEVHLADETGRQVVLREHVAISFFSASTNFVLWTPHGKRLGCQCK